MTHLSLYSIIGIHQGVSEFDVTYCAPLRNAGIVTMSVAVEPPFDWLFRVQLESQQFRRHRLGHIGLDTQSNRGHAGEFAKLVCPRWPTLPRLTFWGVFYLVVLIPFFSPLFNKSNLFIVTRLLYCEEKRAKKRKNKTKQKQNKNKQTKKFFLANSPFLCWLSMYIISHQERHSRWFIQCLVDRL